MRRALLCRIFQCSSKIFSPHPPPNPHLRPSLRIPLTSASPAYSPLKSFKLFSTDETSSPSPKSDPDPEPESALEKPDDEPQDVSADVEDVSNEQLKVRIEKYFNGEEEELPSVLEAILSKKLLKTHEETDDDLVEELQYQPVEKISDEEFDDKPQDVSVDVEDVNNECTVLYFLVA